MRFLDDVMEGVKALVWNGPVGSVVGSGVTGWGFRRDEDKREWTNSAVWACLNFGINTFPEAPIMVEERNVEGQWEEVIDHDVTQLVNNPNPWHTGSQLWAGALTSNMMSGDGYWIIRRDGFGYPVELFYWPHWALWPVHDPDNPNELIDHYSYRFGYNQEKPLPVDRVCHFRHGIDPDNLMHGLCSMDSVITDRLTDDEANMATYFMMKHGGMKTLIISPKDPRTTIKEEEGKVLAKQFVDRSTGKNRGMPITPSLPVDFNSAGVTPQDMLLDKLRGVSASRICAALGIDPMVVGLPSDNRTYSNYAEAREAAYESFIIPKQRAFAETLDRTLLPSMGDPSKQRVAFDLKKVRVLQDDFDKLAKSIATLYEKQIIDRATAKQKLGIKWDSSDQGVYYVVKVSQKPGQDAGNPDDAQETPDGTPTLAMKELGL